MNVKRLRILPISIMVLFFCVAHAEVHGTLRVVKGIVKIKSAKTGQITRARIGQIVYPKDVIVTAPESRAKVVMVDNNEINISPNTQLEIKQYQYDPAKGKKNVLLDVLYGKVRATVEQKYDGKTSKFQVKTPAAVAGVRGTDFMTSFNPNSQASSVVTFRGKVEFGLPGPNGTIMNSVFVTPGKIASSLAGHAPNIPVSVPRSQLVKMDHDSNADTASTTPTKLDNRQPANDQKNKNGDKQDQGQGQSQGQAQGHPQAQNGGDDGGRSPASMNGGGCDDCMVKPHDIDCSGSSCAPIPNVAPPTGPMPMPPPVANFLPNCPMCADMLQNSSHLIIHVNPVQ